MALIGAGPGAADLITVRGARLLAAAELIVHDALVDPALWDGLRCPRVDVGKRAGRHAMRQDEINALLIAEARAGRRVVRLKGGDPFVLGRGSEEALALAAAGVPFELVPGLSSATAGPLLAGIPLTHRGVADAFCVVSAHPRELDASFTLPRWRARLTVVVLMGVRTAPRWTAALLAGGWPAETPMAWVMWAARAEQRSARATLGRAVEAATAHGIDAPAVAVVGGVAGLPPLEVAPARTC